jgi:hypothetical protein
MNFNAKPPTFLDRRLLCDQIVVALLVQAFAGAALVVSKGCP